MDEKVTIKVKQGTLSQLLVNEQGDWIDLRTDEDVALMPFQYYEISLGIAMKLPKGYEAIVAPRSSTYRKYNIIQTNGIGIIDESYCGEEDVWKMPVIATKATIIPKGTRVAQFRLVKHQPAIEFEEGDLNDRARGGLGSTGD